MNFELAAHAKLSTKYRSDKRFLKIANFLPSTFKRSTDGREREHVEPPRAILGSWASQADHPE